jgi:DNA-binding transcriptional ArsR family regulator
MVRRASFGYPRIMPSIHTDAAVSAAGVSEVAKLIANGPRAAMLDVLMDGEAHPAGVLAREAGVAPSTASGHLGALADGDLITIERVGRQRRYRLSGPEVAHAIESLSALAPAISVSSLRQSTNAEQLRRARTCYDHLAGQLGVAVTETLVSDRALRRVGDAFELTRSGRSLLEGLGIELEGARRRKRGFALACQDWTERRSHLAGALGAALCDRFIELAWIRRRPGGRSVILTEEGARGLAALGIDSVKTQFSNL